MGTVPASPIAGIPIRLACTSYFGPRVRRDVRSSVGLLASGDATATGTGSPAVGTSSPVTKGTGTGHWPLDRVLFVDGCRSRIDKAPEMFSYQASIVRPSRNFEGNSYVGRTTVNIDARLIPTGISIGSGSLARGAGVANAPPPPPLAAPHNGGAKLPTSAISDLSDYNIDSHLSNTCSDPRHDRIATILT